MKNVYLSFSLSTRRAGIVRNNNASTNPRMCFLMVLRESVNITYMVLCIEVLTKSHRTIIAAKMLGIIRPKPIDENVKNNIIHDTD